MGGGELRRVGDRSIRTTPGDALRFEVPAEAEAFPGAVAVAGGAGMR